MIKFSDYKAVLFDLDGVIVDTAKYHYLAWRRLAQELGGSFTQESNELLKGVSRKKSLELMLKEIGMAGMYTDIQMETMAQKKNQWYQEYLGKLTQNDILPGALECLILLKEYEIKTALGSASKNAVRILEHLGIKELFQVIVDGNLVTHAKPDPEVFTLGARLLGIPCGQCVVVEDSMAGIEAAHAAGMHCIGVGETGQLKEADIVVKNLLEIAVK